MESPKSIWKRLAIIVGSGSLIVSVKFAQADSFTDNRLLFPIGEVEAFMANTGVALSGSTGAVIFNPAGLGGFKNNRISLSGNAYMKVESEIVPLQTMDGTDLNFSTSGIQAIPHSFVSTWRTSPWTLAFSIMVPYQIKLEDAVLYSSPIYPSIQLSRTNYFQLLMGGGSLAVNLTRETDVGLGCLYTMYQTSQMVSFAGNTNGTPNAFVSNSFFRAEIAGVLCNAGMQSQLTDKLRVGLSVQLPMIPLKKTGVSSTFVRHPSGVTQSEGPKPVDGEYKIPLDVGVGLEYRFSSVVHLYLDVSHQAEERFRSGDLLEAEIVNKATTRYNGGLRLKFSEGFQVFAGAAYNPSALVGSDDNVAEDYVVATMGFNWVKGNSSFGMGVMGARSSGSRKAPIYDASIEPIGTKESSLRSDIFGILLSSGYIF